MKIITETELLEELKLFIKNHKTLTEAAKVIGVGVSYLCDCLHRRTAIGPKITKALGYSKINMYQKKIKMIPKDGYFEVEN